ncbi:zinc-dependent alcohol dehydrogenase family protein [Noviherbaspirillum galbum]|uniref:alcohol dehydrogenase n=1 Tax=Noviherbaspirillum galbum TaxID=2709383 RepID=A0A6B3SX82_9BURK|nr:zinc-dependent alcohol dehydrogenase family protein [Noviherbaspirillum galbum]NEX62349.1 zinc-dependent alcohol dehydrogenase family protein [Noviherbaspirillum galbum]
MLGMRLLEPGQPLAAQWLDVPEPGDDEVLLRVSACGVCRTDLHLADGELPGTAMPITPGHEIVGRIVRAGRLAGELHAGRRVGVAWLADACGACPYCLAGRENLCDRARFTGCQRDGGYAQYVTARAEACLPLPDRYDDLHAAPLLCAGLIGYRAYSMMPYGAMEIGIFGFGAAAHIIAQVARFDGKRIHAFTRPGDLRSQRFARALGASWAGGTDERPPAPLDAAIIFAPAGELVPLALSLLRKGGSVICAGIHMSDIPGFAYSLLWGERRIQSVANLTRADGRSFFAFAARHPLQTTVTTFPLAQANAALEQLRQGAFDGAAVLVP